MISKNNEKSNKKHLQWNKYYVIILRHYAREETHIRSVPHPDVPDGGRICSRKKNQGGK